MFSNNVCFFSANFGAVEASATGVSVAPSLLSLSAAGINVAPQAISISPVSPGPSPVLVQCNEHTGRDPCSVLWIPI